MSDPQQRSWLDELLEELSRTQPGVRVGASAASLQEAEGAVLIGMDTGGTFWLGVAGRSGSCPGFGSMQEVSAGGMILRLCPCDAANAAELRRILPFTRPTPLGRMPITISVNDPMGMAAPGIVSGCADIDATPMLCLPFGRGCTDDRPCAAAALDAATWTVFRQGYHDAWGADADHVLTEEETERALAAGCTMITADMRGLLHEEFAAMGRSGVKAAYDTLDPDYRAEIEKHYRARSFTLAGGGSVRFSELEMRRAALINHEALDACSRLYAVALSVRGEGGFDFELSLDEGEVPTSPQSHLFVALEARRKGMTLAAVAPRFDTEGMPDNQEAFESSFKVHASIAGTLGHRISVQTAGLPDAALGAIGKIAAAGYHLGARQTGWDAVLDVASRHDPDLHACLSSGPPADRETRSRILTLLSLHAEDYRAALSDRIHRIFALLGVQKRPAEHRGRI